MISTNEVITVLKKANYTDVKYLDGVYVARNILGHSRIFRPSLLTSTPLEVYAIRPIDLESVDFDNVVDIKMILLDFKGVDANNKITHMVKLQDFFYKITPEEAKLIETTYDNVDYYINN